MTVPAASDPTKHLATIIDLDAYRAARAKRETRREFLSITVAVFPVPVWAIPFAWGWAACVFWVGYVPVIGAVAPHGRG